MRRRDRLSDEAFHWYWKALAILDKNYGTGKPAQGGSFTIKIWRMPISSGEIRKTASLLL